MNIFRHSMALRILRILLGMIFVFASWHKITDPAQFAKIIYGYGLFPGSWINILAIWVPFLELTIGVCLILGIFQRPALLAFNVLLTGFILIISINLIRGHEFDCGCFSFTHSSTGIHAAASLLLRDLLLLAAGVYLYVCLVENSRAAALSN